MDSSFESTETEEEEPVTDTEESEYTVPAVSAEEAEVTLSDIRTSDDAVYMFLREQIDEDLLAQAVNKYGKPSVRYQGHPDDPAVVYGKELPTWVYQEPEGQGATMEERMETAEQKAQEREEATAASEEAPE